MSFNEMAVKFRQFGLAFVAVTLSLAIVLIARGEDVAIPIPYFIGWRLNVSVIIVLATIVALWSINDVSVSAGGNFIFCSKFYPHLRRVIHLNKIHVFSVIGLVRGDEPGSVPVNAGQLFRFVHEMAVGDLVVYPSKRDRLIHIGRIVGPLSLSQTKS